MAIRVKTAPKGYKQNYAVPNHALDQFATRIQDPSSLASRKDTEIRLLLDWAVNEATKRNDFEDILDTTEPSTHVVLLNVLGEDLHALVRDNDWSSGQTKFRKAIITVLSRDIVEKYYATGKWKMSRGLNELSDKLKRLLPNLEVAEMPNDAATATTQEMTAAEAPPPPTASVADITDAQAATAAEPVSTADSRLITFSRNGGFFCEELQKGEALTRRLAALYADAEVGQLKVWKEAAYTVHIDVD